MVEYGLGAQRELSNSDNTKPALDTQIFTTVEPFIAYNI